ncbi:MAG TPA: serine/threonine-protein kinase [Candidatus Saccharimonadales bacterium]|jgi:serine/threonine protein kinase|nr:serine/threonine-protein kinase [Candidatus Saccharimonadales bacterium]
MKDFEPKWKFVKNLGEGGQAHTYLVESTEISSSMGAAKRLKNEKREPRFNDEIEALQRVDHANILKLLDIGTTPKGMPYLVSQYCPNGELTPAFFKDKSLLDIVRFFRHICDAVATAHRANVIHRDLKPSNIFLGDRDQPIIGDFGICFLSDRNEADPRITEAYEVVASRWFGAPEARNGRLADVKPAADIYSLGKLLHWMACGGKVFDREEHRKLRYRIEGTSELDQNVELINQLLDEAIIEHPEARIPTAIDLLYKVDRLIARMEAGGHAISLEVSHRCLFCAEGQYKVLVNGLEGNAQAAGSEASSLFGWGAPTAYPAWLIMVCDFCGNVQTFRPDLPESKGPGFGLQQANERKKRWTTKRNS